MTAGIPGATYVARYSDAERAIAAENALGLSAPPQLMSTVSVTPNAPYAKDGSRVSVWKPSFVLGTPDGGEVGVNFWGIYNQGHVNVGFTAKSAGTYLLDARLLSAGDVSYKVYSGKDGKLTGQGEETLHSGHLFVMVTASSTGGPVSVELWPSPEKAMFGFLGCDICRAELPGQ